MWVLLVEEGGRECANLPFNEPILNTRNQFEKKTDFKRVQVVPFFVHWNKIVIGY